MVSDFTPRSRLKRACEDAPGPPAGARTARTIGERDTEKADRAGDGPPAEAAPGTATKPGTTAGAATGAAATGATGATLRAAAPDVRCATPGRPPCDARVETYLPPERSAAGNARDFVKTILRGWDLPGLTDDAAMITTELFSNALRHAPSEQYVLAVDWTGGRPRIEMWDSTDRLPRKQNPGIDAETGRGLHVIEALSTSWGSHRAASGKCVWATL
jgi:anti-sigma regulatory factor (Ser/Thr protein kinase)